MISLTFESVNISVTPCLSAANIFITDMMYCLKFRCVKAWMFYKNISCIGRKFIKHADEALYFFFTCFVWFIIANILCIKLCRFYINLIFFCKFSRKCIYRIVHVCATHMTGDMTKPWYLFQSKLDLCTPLFFYFFKLPVVLKQCPVWIIFIRPYHWIKISIVIFKTWAIC